MVIDPIEAVIAWLTTALTTAGGRVAGKHRYGDAQGAWADDATGVSVHMDGGPVDLYATVATPRLEICIYAKDDQTKVAGVWRELVGLSRANKRFAQTTSHGGALIHYFLPVTSLSLTYDHVLKKELGIVFFESMVSEVAIE
jgi:hypothetical protein